MDTEHEVTDERQHAAPLASASGALRRSSTKRIVAGVAGGLSDRFDLDVTIIRALFVVLTLLWGFGAALYLALWVFMARDDAPAIDAPDADTAQVAQRAERGRAVLLAAAVIVLGLLFLAVVTRGPRWGSGVSVAWLVFLVVLAALSLRGTRRFSLARLFSGLLLAVATVVILAAGGFLGLVAMTGVPMSGGVGSRFYEPVALSEVHSSYHLAFGTMTLDLRRVAFKGRTTSVAASVAAGQLTVIVPSNVVLNVSAANGVPHIYYPQGSRLFYASAPSGSHRGHLNLAAQVGVGRLELVRAGVGAPVPGR